MMMNNKNVVILVRVSSSRQETDRQINELVEYADKQNYQVIEILEEVITGKADAGQRSGIKRATELARAGNIDKVLVHEISRLARKNSVAHKFLETLDDCGVSLYWHQHSIETLLENGKRNPTASIMFSLLSELARNELETLSSRIRSGMAQARKKGHKIGRPEGSVVSKEEFLEKHCDVVRQLKKGKSIRDVAKILAKGASTVQRVRKMLKEEGVLVS